MCLIILFLATTTIITYFHSIIAPANLGTLATTTYRPCWLTSSARWAGRAIERKSARTWWTDAYWRLAMELISCRMMRPTKTASGAMAMKISIELIRRSWRRWMTEHLILSSKLCMCSNESRIKMWRCGKIAFAHWLRFECQGQTLVAALTSLYSSLPSAL